MQTILLHRVYIWLPFLAQLLVGPIRVRQTGSYCSGDGYRESTREAQVLFPGIHFSSVIGCSMISRETVSSVINFCFSITDHLKVAVEVLGEQLSFR